MHGDPGFKYLGFIAFRSVSTEFGPGDVKVSPLPPSPVAVAASSFHFATLGTPIASAVAVSSNNLASRVRAIVRSENITLSKQFEGCLDLVYIIFVHTIKFLVAIDHFTVVSLVTWPWIVSEAGVDLVLKETSLLFICKSCCSYAN